MKAIPAKAKLERSDKLTSVLLLTVIKTTSKVCSAANPNPINPKGFLYHKNLSKKIKNLAKGPRIKENPKMKREEKAITALAVESRPALK